MPDIVKTRTSRVRLVQEIQLNAENGVALTNARLPVDAQLKRFFRPIVLKRFLTLVA